MQWSITKSKMFSKCQRKWFYYELLASATSNDPVRKEAYYLKQLQSISAWRGSLVDTIIHEKVVPLIRINKVPDLDEVLRYTDDVVKSQIHFGIEKKYRENGISKNRVGNKYCAFYDVEYNDGLNNDSLSIAIEEAKKALNTLLDSDLIQRIAKENEYVISQRSLMFNLLDEIKVTCTPDMVVFFKKKPPLIIDWKVHYFGNSDAWLQLGIYGIALSKVHPHRDFPESQKNHLEKPNNFRLLEYQLLKNVLREYSLKKEDVLDIEDYIFRSYSQMIDLINGKNIDQIDFSIFKTARRPQICGWCQFKKLCWAHNPKTAQEPIQLTLAGVFK